MRSQFGPAWFLHVRVAPRVASDADFFVAFKRWGVIFFPRPKSAVHVYVEFYAPYKQTWRAAMAFVASIHNNGWRWLKWSSKAITSTADEAALTDIVQFNLACVGRRRVFRCERNSSIAESRRPAAAAKVYKQQVPCYLDGCAIWNLIFLLNMSLMYYNESTCRLRRRELIDLIIEKLASA
jgi:hypothetical protein